MNSVKVPMKVGGGFKQNASLEQGVLVLTATQRTETTTRHHHTEKLQLLKPGTHSVISTSIIKNIKYLNY